MIKKNKRYNLLLEVLIALTIVALAALPLIYPHVAIMREQKRLLSETNLDHFVNIFYADLIVQLYRNEVAWSDIAQGRVFTIPEEILERAGLPYKGTYRFKILNTKPREPVDTTYNLVQLTFDFWPRELVSEQEKKNKQLTFNYNVYIERKYEKAS